MARRAVSPAACCLSILWRRCPARGRASWLRLTHIIRARFALRQRDQHRYLLAVAAVLVAEQRNEIALLQPDADQDVAGGRDGEQQMSGRHHGRRPEGNQESEVDWMPDGLI